MVILHLNTTSLPKNKIYIQCFLLELTNLPDGIAITKTEINCNKKHTVDLQDYKFVHADSPSHAGGVYTKRFEISTKK